MQKEKAYLNLYKILQVAASPLLPVASLYGLLHPKYKEQFLSRLGTNPPIIKEKGARIWVHAMSLGELNAATPLIDALSSSTQGANLIVSASTRSGLKALQKRYGEKEIKTTSLPFDLFFITKRVINKLRPHCFILVETDIWPGFLWELHKSGCKIILANGSISSRAAKRISKVPGLAHFLYNSFTRLCMQSQEDAYRLKKLGIEDNKIESFGNLKFDIVPPQITPKVRKSLLEITGFPDNSTILCAGSTHAPEEQLILEAFLQLRQKCQDLRLIIAPRDVKRAKEVEKLFKKVGLSCKFRSRPQTSNNHEVFILDTLGELKQFYSICHIAFVGGSLAPVGGHNLLEPIGYGRPVIFGPYIESCKEIGMALIEKRAGFMVKNENELMQKIEGLLTNDKMYRMAKEAAKSFLEPHRGVTSRYVQMIETIVRNDKMPQ